MRLVVTLAALVGAGACGRTGFDELSQYSFVDRTQADFQLGSFDAGMVPVGWLSDRLQLAMPPPFTRLDIGAYVSRPLDTGDPGAVWDTLAWVPPAPQGRPLADGAGRDEGYLEGAIDMMGSHVLLHFEGTGDAASTEPVLDSSGGMHDGVITLAGQGATYVDGAFGAALHIERDAWVRLDGNDFDFATGDFTYAVWAKMFDCAESNDNRIALGGAGAGDTPHMWIGALCPDACPGGDGAFMNWLSSARTGGTVDVCSGVVLDDGNWHHLVGVKAGHTSPAARLSLYVDGALAGTTTFDYGADTFTYDAGEIRLGSFNLADPTYNTRIIVDEAAIWKRAFSASDVDALYRRGALHLELQFRVCPDGTCDTEPFVGPDGSSTTYFSEADLSGPAGSQRGNLAALGLVGAVGQYRVQFSTAMPMVSPALLGVAVDARRP